jgi:flagellar hook-associated protein 1 FlgK
MSDFFGLRIGTSALLAHRRAMDVVGHNLANVNTEGFSRQRVSLAAEAGPTGTALFARWARDGQGVKVLGVDRLRDMFLETRGHQEHGAGASLSTLRNVLDRIELAVGEPSDNGIAAQLGSFMNAWDDVANRPDDPGARAALVERAKIVTSGFQALDANLATQRSQIVTDLTSMVSEVNTIAGRVAELNRTIQVAVVAGQPSSDLMDQRDLLVMQLADKVGVTTRAGENGTVDVYLSGSTLVRGDRAEALRVDVASTPAQTVSVNLAGWNLPASVGGAAAAMLTAANDTIPRYRAEFGAAATALMSEVNAAHATGFDLSGVAGQAFFVSTPAGVEVNLAIAADPRLVAASGSPTASRDGSVAARIAGLHGAADAYRSTVVGLGVETQSTTRRDGIQQLITGQVDAARQGESGVNLDEEMANLVGIQRAYEAAARFVTAVDQALETLIKGTGLVGR